MTKIELNITADLEQAIKAAYPGEETAAVLVRLIEQQLKSTATISATDDAIDDRVFDDTVQSVLRLRQEPPFAADDAIRNTRDDVRR
jgi:hypothetical protein